MKVKDKDLALIQNDNEELMIDWKDIKNWKANIAYPLAKSLIPLMNFKDKDYYNENANVVLSQMYKHIQDDCDDPNLRKAISDLTCYCNEIDKRRINSINSIAFNYDYRKAFYKAFDWLFDCRVNDFDCMIKEKQQNIIKIRDLRESINLTLNEN